MNLFYLPAENRTTVASVSQLTFSARDIAAINQNDVEVIDLKTVAASGSQRRRLCGNRTRYREKH